MGISLENVGKPVPVAFPPMPLVIIPRKTPTTPDVKLRAKFKTNSGMFFSECWRNRGGADEEIKKTGSNIYVPCRAVSYSIALLSPYAKHKGLDKLPISDNRSVSERKLSYGH